MGWRTEFSSISTSALWICETTMTVDGRPAVIGMETGDLLVTGNGQRAALDRRRVLMAGDGSRGRCARGRDILDAVRAQKREERRGGDTDAGRPFQDFAASRGTGIAEHCFEIENPAHPWPLHIERPCPALPTHSATSQTKRTYLKFDAVILS